MQLLYRESLITTRGVTEKIVVGGVGSVDLDWADSLMDVQNAWRSRALRWYDAVKALLHTSLPVPLVMRDSVSLDSNR